MWTDRVVVTSPEFDDHVRFVRRIEEFPVQQFISQFAIKRFDIAVLPGTARLNEQGCDGEQALPKLFTPTIRVPLRPLRMGRTNSVG